MLSEVTTMQVGATIRERRDELRLSAREAARLGGVSPTTWSDLEADKHPPSPSTQRAVAKALGWQVDWFDRVMAGEAPDFAVTPFDLYLQANPGLQVTDTLLAFIRANPPRDIEHARELHQRFRWEHPEYDLVDRVTALEEVVTRQGVLIDRLTEQVLRLEALQDADDETLPGATRAGRAGE